MKIGQCANPLMTGKLLLLLVTHTTANVNQVSAEMTAVAHLVVVQLAINVEKMDSAWMVCACVTLVGLDQHVNLMSVQATAQIMALALSYNLIIKRVVLVELKEDASVRLDGKGQVVKI